MSEEHETTSEDLLREFQENPPSNIEDSNQRSAHLSATMRREFDETKKAMFELKQKAIAAVDILIRDQMDKTEQEQAKLGELTKKLEELTKKPRNPPTDREELTHLSESLKLMSDEHKWETEQLDKVELSLKRGLKRETEELDKEQRDLERRLKQLQSDKEEIKKEGAKAISIAEERLIIDRAEADQGIKTIRSFITANPKLEEDREELLLICDKLSNGIHNPGDDLEELEELGMELMKRVGLEEFMIF